MFPATRPDVEREGTAPLAPTVPVQFLRATVEALVERGFDIERALQDTGLDWQQSPAEGSRLTPEQVNGLIRHFWDVTNDELLGLGPRPVPRGTLRLAGLTLIHTRDLRSALSRMLELGAVWTGIECSLEPSDARTVTVRIRTPATIDPLVAFALIGATHRFASWLVGSPIRLRALEFATAADDLADDYVKIFGIRPVFGAPGYAISLDSATLTTPVVRTEADLKDFLRDAPGTLFYTHRHAAPISDQVRIIVQRNPTGPWLSATELASRLSISAPHMRRLLAEEGTSQRRIRDEVLRDRAVDALVHGDEPIASIGARLGFSEPSAFRRAFRRWTGSAPSEYRSGADPVRAQSSPPPTTHHIN